MTTDPFRQHLARRSLLKAMGIGALGLASVPLMSSCGSAASAEALASDDTSDFDFTDLSITAMVNSSYGNVWGHVSELFKKETGGTFTATPVPYTQLAQKQLLDVQSGAGQYDIYQFQYPTIGTLVEAGGLVDLTDWVAANPNVANLKVAASFKSSSIFQGRQHGIAYGGVRDLVFANTAILEEFKLDVPTTWEEFTIVADEVTAKGKGEYFGSAIQGTKDNTTLLMSYGNRLSGFGGSYLDASGKPVLNSPEAIAALTEFTKQINAALPTPAEVAWQQASSAFLEGRVALADNWGDISYVAADPKQSKIVGQYTAVQLLPGGGNATVKPVTVNAEVWGVATGSQQPEASAAFLQWMLQPRVAEQLQAIGDGNWPSYDRDVLEANQYGDPFASLHTEGFDEEHLLWPTGPDALKATQDLSDQVSLALAGQQGVEESLENAQAAWEGSELSAS